MNALKFSAQFAKRYYWAAFRFGIIESSGGVGFDLFFFKDQLSLHTDIFDFANPRLQWPRIRTTLAFSFLNHFYVDVGVDDYLNNPVYSQLDNRILAGRDVFVGVGIFFTDDDLKGLAPVVPSVSR